MTDSKVFQFEELLGNFTENKPAPHSAAAGSLEDDLLKALSAAGAAAYRWDIPSDSITWSANAADILGCPPENARTGRHYAALLDPANDLTRYDAVMNTKVRDHGAGVRFQIEYALRAQGRGNPAVRLEDNGQWHAAEDGSPRLAYGTIRRVDDRHSWEQQLASLGLSDPLTGMMNRGPMGAALEEAIKRAQKSGGNCAFAILAINGLDAANDAYGYDIADEVILTVGSRLRQVIRTGDAIARYSGTKFAIILHDCSERDLAAALVRFISTIRDNAVETKRGPVWVTVSTGAVALPHNGDSAATAIAHAEEALSQARQMQDGTGVIHQRSEHKAAKRDKTPLCASALVQCLKDETFQLAYQPIVSAKSGQHVCHETLLRVPSRHGSGFVDAGEIIPLTTQLGMMPLFDRAVLQKVLRALVANPELHLSMNISAASIADSFWHDQILELLHANEAEAGRLTVEFNEGQTLVNPASTRRLMERLREAGASVALDQFGQGLASFRHLRELPINLLKFDGALCRGIADDAGKEILLRGLLDLARHLGVKTVAQWVETENDALLLSSWGADYLQGNHLGRPEINPAWLRQSQPAASETVATTAEITPVAMDETDTLQPVPTVLATIEVEELAHANETAVSEAPAAEGQLDFTAIDDSIARLREALAGLSTRVIPTPEEDPSTEAA